MAALRASSMASPKFRPALILRGHTSTVYSVAFDAHHGLPRREHERRYLASGSYDSTVKVWDLEAGRLASTLYGHAGSVSSVTFSPGRGLLATGSNDHQVRLWRLAEFFRRRLAAIRRLGVEAHAGAVYSVAFTPDERWLISGGTDNTIHLVNLATPHSTPEITLHGHTGYVYQVAVSPDGRWLASASMDNTVALWRFADVLRGQTESPLVWLRGHTDGVTSLAFSQDGKRLASGSYDRTIKLWDLSLLPYDLTTLRYPAPLTLHGHEDCVQSVAFSPDGARLASASSDYSVRLWRIDDVRPYPVGVLRRHSDKVHAVAFSPDGSQIASGSRDSTVIIWRAD